MGSYWDQSITSWPFHETCLHMLIEEYLVDLYMRHPFIFWWKWFGSNYPQDLLSNFDPRISSHRLREKFYHILFQTSQDDLSTKYAIVYWRRYHSSAYPLNIPSYTDANIDYWPFLDTNYPKQNQKQIQKYKHYIKAENQGSIYTWDMSFYSYWNIKRQPIIEHVIIQGTK